jgi:hypothetical protein
MRGWCGMVSMVWLGGMVRLRDRMERLHITTRWHDQNRTAGFRSRVGQKLAYGGKSQWHDALGSILRGIIVQIDCIWGRCTGDSCPWYGGCLSFGDSHLQVYHTFKCPTYPSVSLLASFNSHNGCPHSQVSHIFGCSHIHVLVCPVVSRNDRPVIQVSAIRVAHTSKCLTPPSAYSFGVSHHQVRVWSVSPSECLTHNHAYLVGVSHIQVPIHSVSCLQVHRISECLFIGAPHLQVSDISKWLLIQCHASECLTHPSVLHIWVLIHSVSHISECLTHPSACLFNVSCTRVPIHSMSHIQAPCISKCLLIQCLTPPSAHSFSVSQLQVYRISKCLFIQCLMPLCAVRSVSHVRVSHISECMVSKCLTYPNVWFPIVSHIQVLDVQLSECMASKCLTYSSVWFPSASHIRVYGF